MINARTTVLFCLMSLGGMVYAAPVSRIEVRSTTAAPVDPASVQAFTRIKVGDEFAARAAADDVKALQETGRFSFVSSSVEQTPAGLVVVYSVEPKPRIRRIRIEGAEYFSNSKIRTLMDLEVGALIDEADLAVRGAKVREEYQKKYFPNAKVNSKIEPFANSGQADVIITVEEGNRAKVRSIVYDGAPKEILPKLYENALQKPTNIWSWITGSGTYDADKVSADQLFARERLRGIGYLDAKVGDPTITSKKRDGVIIQFPVVLGTRYTIESIRIEGVEKFPRAQIMQRVTLNPGDHAALDQVDKVVQAIRDFYGERGYLGTPVTYQLVPVEEGKVDLLLRISERSIVTIRDIIIRGNVRTQDKVIRRELSVYPGEVYNEVAVRRSAARVRNLGYFKFAHAHPSPTSEPDKVDLILDVEEESSGSFVGGVGFSSIDNLIGFIELQQGNFNLGGFPSDLVGGGQKVKIGMQLGTKRRDINFSFVEPWFLDRKLSLGFDVFQHERRFLSDDYDQRNTGTSLGLSRSLNSFWRTRLAYSIEHIKVFNVDDDVSEEIRQEEGSAMESAVSLSFTRDSRNHPFIPTEGSRFRTTGRVAGGPFGFDVDYYQFDVQGTKFIPMPFKHVFNLRGNISTIEPFGDSDRVRIFDRLFVGGPRTLRAFKYRDAGPRDDQGEPVGGQSLAHATAEYTIPLSDKLRFATFYDAGILNRDSYDFEASDYYSDFGIGLRIDIPGFPLQLDYAWPLEADEFNDRNSGRFSFFIGYSLF